MFIEYIKKLLHKWFIYLGFIPLLYDYAEAYFKFNFEIPDFILSVFSLGAFVCASYSVWKGEKKRNIGLEELLKSPIDYEIKAELLLIDFNLNVYLNKIDGIAIEAKKEIEFANSEIKRLYPEDSSSYILQSKLSAGLVYKKTKSDLVYLEELKEYKRKLIDYINNHDVYKKEFKEKIESISRHLYCIDFDIKNIGIKSDSKINIEIKTEKNTFIKEYNIYDHIPRLESLPERPDAPRDMYPKTPSINFVDIPRPTLYENQNTYRSNKKINEKSISITIRDINVGDAVNIFNDILFIYLLDNNDFNIYIKSKELNSVLEKKLVITSNNEAKSLSFYLNKK